MADDHGRIVAGERCAHQPIHVGRARGRHDLQSRRVAHHRLRAVAVLRGAAAAHAVQQVKRDRHGQASARHVAGDRRFVDHLRPREKAEAAGAEIDERPHPRHGGADAGRGGARLGGRRIVDAVAKIRAHAIHQVALRPEPEHVAADQAHAGIGRKAVVERIHQCQGVARLGHAAPQANTWSRAVAAAGSGLSSANLHRRIDARTRRAIDLVQARDRCAAALGERAAEAQHRIMSLEPVAVLAARGSLAGRHADVGGAGGRLRPQRIAARPAPGHCLDEHRALAGAAARRPHPCGRVNGRRIGAVDAHRRDADRFRDQAQVAAGMDERRIALARRPRAGAVVLAHEHAPAAATAPRY